MRSRIHSFPFITSSTPYKAPVLIQRSIHDIKTYSTQPSSSTFPRRYTPYTKVTTRESWLENCRCIFAEPTTRTSVQRWGKRKKFTRKLLQPSFFVGYRAACAFLAIQRVQPVKDLPAEETKYYRAVDFYGILILTFSYNSYVLPYSMDKRDVRNALPRRKSTRR